MDDSPTVVDAVLPNGAPLKVKISNNGGGAQDVSFLDALDFHGIQNVLTGFANMVRESVHSAAPDTVEVEFGLEASVEGGKLVALLTNMNSEASFTVRLGWDKGSA